MDTRGSDPNSNMIIGSDFRLGELKILSRSRVQSTYRYSPKSNLYGLYDLQHEENQSMISIALAQIMLVSGSVVWRVIGMEVGSHVASVTNFLWNLCSEFYSVTA